jgi:hypothetical protein
MTHPLVIQLRFARSEFVRGLEGVTDADGRRRFEPMNCISWNIGHLAWQEQRYWLQRMQHQSVRPELDKLYCYSCPAVAPPLDESWAAWQAVTAAADPYLDTLTEADIRHEHTFTFGNDTFTVSIGTMMLRAIYHYWYHNGENQAIRQLLGHKGLPDFVGNIDGEAPYK